jgi:hypothetical protein
MVDHSAAMLLRAPRWGDSVPRSDESQRTRGLPEYRNGASTATPLGDGAGGFRRRQPTARDLQREIRSRAKRRSDAHKPVLDQLRRRIESKAALDHVRMVYRVPDFIPGLPVFDVTEVAHGLADALSEDGFVAEVFEPDTLYVSWDRNEANSSRRQPGK